VDPARAIAAAWQPLGEAARRRADTSTIMEARQGYSSGSMTQQPHINYHSAPKKLPELRRPKGECVHRLRLQSVKVKNSSVGFCKIRFSGFPGVL
jgi:hypothetical protein